MFFNFDSLFLRTFHCQPSVIKYLWLYWYRNFSTSIWKLESYLENLDIRMFNEKQIEKIADKTSLKRNILAIKQNTNNYINITTHLTIHDTNSNQQQINKYTRHYNRKRNYNHNNCYIQSNNRSHNNNIITIYIANTNRIREYYERI